MEVRYYVINFLDYLNYNLVFVSFILLYVFIMLFRKCGYLSICIIEY